MKKFLRQNGVVLLIIALLLSILIGIGRAVARGNVDPVSNLINSITTPVRNGISSALDWAEGVYTYVFHYSELEQEIADLKAQVAKLEEEVRTSEDAARENDQLRKLLDLQERRRDFTFEAARINARSTSNWESTLTLSKGSDSGLALGNCVVSETGVLVGVISQLGTNWATVSTITNVDIEMGGMVPRTLTPGVLEGDFSLMTEGKLRLSYLPNNVQLLSGDQVLTASSGDVYPSGLVVGRVETVFSDSSGQYRYAVVKPDVDLASLIEVFVIKDFKIIE